MDEEGKKQRMLLPNTKQKRASSLVARQKSECALLQLLLLCATKERTNCTSSSPRFPLTGGSHTERNRAESLSATHALTLSLVTAHREKNEAANAVKLLLKREWQLQLLSFFSLPQPVFPFRSVHSHSHFVCIPCLSVGG